MRRATLVLAALAALAGCSVETEGAACQVPGTTDQCPEGQACGSDLKCSKNPVIDCDAPGLEIAVDAAAPVFASVTPTGAPAPAVCRFRELKPALDLAAERTSAVTVKVYGPSTLTLPAPLPVVISEYTTLTTDSATPDPESHVLQGAAGDAGILEVKGGATLRGFKVTSTGATGDAIEIVCGGQAGAVATLTDVIVDGGAHTAGGVVLGAAACPLEATRLEVRNGTGSGLVVGTGVSTLGATVDGLFAHDNGGQGVRVTGGKLALTGQQPSFASVAANAQGGILLQGALVDATIDGMTVSGNGQVGLYLLNPGSSAVRVRTSVFAKNAGTEYAPANARLAGGVLLRGTSTPATFQFQGNVICGHADDEIGVYSSANWTFGGTSCSPAQNTVYDAAGGKLLFSTSGNVDAQYFSWPTDPPDVDWFSPEVDSDPSCAAAAPGGLPAACQ